MRIEPLQPDALDAETRYVHDEISKLIGKSQGQVSMINDQGALTGPFPPMLKYPQFGVPALSFIRSLDNHATLPPALREVAILTVGGALGARFELYAHEIMAGVFGMAQAQIAILAAGGTPSGMNETQAIVHQIAKTLAHGRIVPDSTYNNAVSLLGSDDVAELIFLIGGYVFLASILNGFDIPAPDRAAPESR